MNKTESTKLIELTKQTTTSQVYDDFDTQLKALKTIPRLFITKGKLYTPQLFYTSQSGVPMVGIMNDEEELIHIRRSRFKQKRDSTLNTTYRSYKERLSNMTPEQIEAKYQQYKKRVVDSGISTLHDLKHKACNEYTVLSSYGFLPRLYKELGFPPGNGNKKPLFDAFNGEY